MSDALLAGLRSAGIDSLDKEAFDHDLYQHIILNEPKAEDNYRQITAYENLTKVLARFGYRNIDPTIMRLSLRKMFEVAERYWTVEEDALPMLQALSDSGYKLAIISNAEDEENVRQLMDKTGFDGLFDVTINSAAFGFAKPGSEIFQTVLHQLNVDPSACLMVGDLLDKDVLGANRMGIRSVWITRRSRHSHKVITDAEMQPWRTITTLGELESLLKEK
jgi:HAD superfamily hydrolase (TIGR01662 family)